VAKRADDGGDGDDMLCAGSLRGLEKKVTSVLSGGAPRPSPWMDRGIGETGKLSVLWNTLKPIRCWHLVPSFLQITVYFSLILSAIERFYGRSMSLFR